MCSIVVVVVVRALFKGGGVNGFNPPPQMLGIFFSFDKQDFIFSERSNCTEFGQLILRKISKFVATKCHILRLKCTKFDIGWAPPQTPLGELTALPQIT